MCGGISVPQNPQNEKERSADDVKNAIGIFISGGAWPYRFLPRGSHTSQWFIEQYHC
jgi:hypothetical protein